MIHVQNLSDEILFPNPENCATLAQIYKSADRKTLRQYSDYDAYYSELTHHFSLPEYLDENEEISDRAFMAFRDDLAARKVYYIKLLIHKIL